MTLRELYEVAGGSYEEVLDRMITEARIEKFVRMFSEDPCVPYLQKALHEENMKEAFIAAHTFKGVCLSMGFTRLYEAVSDVTEALRVEDLQKARSLMSRLEEERVRILHALDACKDPSRA